MYLFSECHPYGVKEILMNNETGKHTCDCIDGWDGERCDRCMDFVTGTRCDSCNRTGFGFQDFPGCSECKRGYIGTLCAFCDKSTGYEKDSSGKCDVCTDGFFAENKDDRPICKPCKCIEGRRLSEKCDSTGQCFCKENFHGEKCENCQEGYEGPNCLGGMTVRYV